jgi:hypothetical protein
MTIYDASGAAVFTLTAGSEPVSGNVILKKGTYRVVFSVVGGAGPLASPLAFALGALVLTDPNGPEPTDTTADPSGSASSDSGSSSDTSYSGSSGLSPAPPCDYSYTTS